MLDPVSKIAFTVQANKGVFALLLGSGISRSAKVPTGWEVTGDLIRRAAVAQGANCGDDPYEFYRQRFGGEPNYSDILETLGRTPEERTALLRTYFEPSEAERERKEKLPTPAHLAIAELVAKGYVRVIITTNFDRLMETALVKTPPVVLSSPDQILGATPLAHTNCTLIKLHGDYLDTRIKNTSQELATYAPEMKRLLAQIFDEYGLIVCGWSGEWDAALISAIESAPNRRYSTFWLAKGGVITDAAQGLVTRRAAEVVEITSADEFFSTLTSKIDAIERLQKPHPLSAALAVAECKRLLSEDKFRIDLFDLVSDEVTKLVDGCRSLSVENVGLTLENYIARIETYESKCEVLVALLSTLAAHGNNSNLNLIVSALQNLAAQPSVGGNTRLLNLRLYPALLCAYAAGVSALLTGHLHTLGAVLAEPIARREYEEDVRLVTLLVSGRIVSPEVLRKVPPYEDKKIPVNERLLAGC